MFLATKISFDRTITFSNGLATLITKISICNFYLKVLCGRSVSPFLEGCGGKIYPLQAIGSQFIAK